VKKKLIFLLLVVASASLYAADVGDLLPGFQLKDQFGQVHTLEPVTKRIYFTHDMAGGKLLKAALGDKGQAVLDSQQAVAMTDVSAMPSVIRSMMALPAMKKRSYQIWIDETGTVIGSLPRKPDQVTVIELDQLKIIAVRFVADEKALVAAGLQSGPSPQ
jgi:hypothetical protein